MAFTHVKAIQEFADLCCLCGWGDIFQSKSALNTPKKEKKKQQKLRTTAVQSTETNNGRSAKIPKSLEKIEKVSV